MTEAKPQRTEIMPAWVVCRCGSDVWCMIHRDHVLECDCPDYEDWQPFDPFLPMFPLEPDA